MKKTLYFDIGTQAKLNKIVKHFKKHKVSESRITRTIIRMTPFDKAVEELNAELGI